MEISVETYIYVHFAATSIDSNYYAIMRFPEVICKQMTSHETRLILQLSFV